MNQTADQVIKVASAAGDTQKMSNWYRMYTEAGGQQGTGMSFNDWMMRQRNASNPSATQPGATLRETLEKKAITPLRRDFVLKLYYEGGEEWMNYAAFCARVSNTPEGADLMDVHFDPVVLKLISILKRALPDYSDEDIFWGYHFVTGALMNTLARTNRINNLSGGLCHSDDFPAVKKRIAHFMAAGFHSLKSC